MYKEPMYQVKSQKKGVCPKDCLVWSNMCCLEQGVEPCTYSLLHKCTAWPQQGLFTLHGFDILFQSLSTLQDLQGISRFVK